MKVHQDKAFTPGAMVVDVMSSTPNVGGRPQVSDRGVSTTPDPGIHHPTAIVVVVILGEQFCSGVPIAVGEVRLDALVHRLAAFSNRGVGRLSCSNPAIAASRSASSNTSVRLIISPSIAKTAISRHSACKPVLEVPCAA